MTRPKKKPGSIRKYTSEDGKFINSDTRQLANDPEVFEEILEQLEERAEFDGTTPLEIILDRFRDEARQYPEFFEREKDQVISSAVAIYEAVDEKDPEKAAIEAMRLSFAAVRANQHDATMHGARRIAAFPKPKPHPEQRLWRSAFRWVIKNHTAKKPMDVIKYFKKNYGPYNERTFTVDENPIWYEKDQEDKPRLCMQYEGKDHVIGFKRIEALFYEARKELQND